MHTSALVNHIHAFSSALICAADVVADQDVELFTEAEIAQQSADFVNSGMSVWF